MKMWQNHKAALCLCLMIFLSYLIKFWKNQQWNIRICFLYLFILLCIAAISPWVHSRYICVYYSSNIIDRAYNDLTNYRIFFLFYNISFSAKQPLSTLLRLSFSSFCLLCFFFFARYPSSKDFIGCW